MPSPLSLRRRLVLALLSVLLVLPLPACTWLFSSTSSSASSTVPRWECPTPTSRPYGQDGPIKEYHDGAPDPTTGIPVQEPVYFEQWEQEYPDLGPPFPAPTTLSRSGTVFYLGQLINLGDGSLDVQVSVEPTGTVSNTDQLYLVRVKWINRGAAIPFTAGRQVAINELLLDSGRKTSGNWITNNAAIQQAGLLSADAFFRQDIPAGTTEQIVPIFAPRGTIQTAELRLDAPGRAEDLRIRFINAQEPHCDHPGTENGYYDAASKPVLPPGVPPGTDGVVAFALSQVGRPYCWGGKGYSPCDGFGGGSAQVTPGCDAQGGVPCWDCSGLSWGAYNSVGIVIGHGTSNQSRYQEVPVDQIQPGDLMLFSNINAAGRGARITHVGLFVGDVTGDGSGDLVHAANYPDGVLISNNVLGNQYYKSHLVIVTRPLRG